MKNKHPQLIAIGSRLKVYMTKNKIGLNKLGRMTGTSGAQIHNIREGVSYGLIHMLAIFKACPDMDKNYILFGGKKK